MGIDNYVLGRLSGDCVTVAGRPLGEFGAAMKASPTFTKTLDIETFQGRDRSTLFLLKNQINAMYLRAKIDFFGTNRERITAQSDLEAVFLTASAPVRLDILDGFWYNAVMISAAESVTDREQITTVEYSFLVTRHQDPITARIEGSARHYCPSNVPRTDCVLTVPSLSSGELVQVNLNGLAWYYTIPSGQNGALVLDGVNKVFRFEGANVTKDVEWTDFPFLVPGPNSVTIFVDTAPYLSAKSVIDYTPSFV